MSKQLGVDLREKKNEKKYLVFRLNEDCYAVPLSDVKEVIGLPKFVPLPQSPDYFLGLINLRGQVVSAIDLKKKLGVASNAQNAERAAVILVEGEKITIGNVVDSVVEVLTISESFLERTVEVNTAGGDKYVHAIARFTDRPMILILDIKRATDISEFITSRNIEVA